VCRDSASSLGDDDLPEMMIFFREQGAKSVDLIVLDRGDDSIVQGEDFIVLGDDLIMQGDDFIVTVQAWEDNSTVQGADFLVQRADFIVQEDDSKRLLAGVPGGNLNFRLCESRTPGQGPRPQTDCKHDHYPTAQGPRLVLPSLGCEKQDFHPKLPLAKNMAGGRSGGTRREGERDRGREEEERRSAKQQPMQ
jgi:hypothetical protein